MNKILFHRSSFYVQHYVYPEVFILHPANYYARVFIFFQEYLKKFSGPVGLKNMDAQKEMHDAYKKMVSKACHGETFLKQERKRRKNQGTYFRRSTI